MAVAVMKSKRPYGGANRYGGCGLGRTCLRTAGWLTALALGMAFFALVSVTLLASYRWITASSLFELTRVEVMGNQRLAYGEVLDAAGLSIGMNSLDIRLGEVTARLMANPWVEGVSARRVLPDGFVVDLRERRPAFLVVQRGELFYAGAAGRVIDRVRPGAFAALPVLTVEEGASTAALDRLPARLRALAEAGFDPAGAHWVTLTGDGLLALGTDAGVLELGGLDRGPGEDLAFAANLARLQRVVTDLKGRGEWTGIRRITARGARVIVVK